MEIVNMIKNKSFEKMGLLTVGESRGVRTRFWIDS